MNDIERLREIFYDIQKINEKINLSIWYWILTIKIVAYEKDRNRNFE